MSRVLAFFFVTCAWAADADLILHNGKIVTVDARFSVQQAVAVKGGKITAVGRDAEVLKERGPATRVIDLKGRTVLPGLFDSHVHALEAGLSEYRAPLPALDSFPAVQAYLRERARSTPKGEWIVVPRTFPTRLTEMQMPTREVLDVVPDHPVMFDASYVVIANSMALRVSGITRDTPNPPGGEIVHDAKGEPNGILKNAQKLLKGVPRAAAGFSEADRLQALEGPLKLYGKTDPDDRGQLFIAPEKLTAVMRAARDRGWQLTTHDQGGGAVDTWLDTLAALDRERPIRGSRSFVMHASFQSPEAIARMKKMGILADTQSQWLYHDGPALEKVFGHAGMRYFFPLRSYLDAGIVVAAGSDHMIGHDKNRAVNPYNPFLSMWIMVARKTDRGDVLYPEERITRAEALKTHTIWSAYMQFTEKQKGSLEVGKLADLVVIDRDIMTCPEDQIKDIDPVMTVVDGRVAFEH